MFRVGSQGEDFLKSHKYLRYDYLDKKIKHEQQTKIFRDHVHNVMDQIPTMWIAKEPEEVVKLHPNGLPGGHIQGSEIIVVAFVPNKHGYCVPVNIYFRSHHYYCVIGRNNLTIVYIHSVVVTIKQVVGSTPTPVIGWPTARLWKEDVEKDIKAFVNRIKPSSLDYGRTLPRYDYNCQRRLIGFLQGYFYKLLDDGNYQPEFRVKRKFEHAKGDIDNLAFLIAAYVPIWETLRSSSDDYFCQKGWQRKLLNDHR